MGRNSFTLVEMLVVTGIILVSVGFGTARLGDYTNRRILADEAKEITNVLSQASKRAVAGDSGSACANFQGFQVSVTTTDAYSVRRCCEGACNSAQSTVQETHQLPVGLRFVQPAVNTTYLFNKLNQTVTANPSANLTISVRSTALARCIPLTISPAGLVTQGAEIAC